MKGLKFLAVGVLASVMFASCGETTQQPKYEGITKAEVDSVPPSFLFSAAFVQPAQESLKKPISQV